MVHRAFLEDVKPLAVRYFAATVLRLAWYAINSGFELYPSVVLPLPPPTSGPAVFFIVDIGLTIWQAVLVLKALGIGLLRYRPELAEKLHLTAALSGGRGFDLAMLGRAVNFTPFFLAAMVLFTCAFVQWLIVGVPRGIPFAYMRLDSPGWIIGAILAVAGLVYGNRFTARAKAQVGSSFGVAYLDANHPLSLRVAGHADRLGITPLRWGL